MHTCNITCVPRKQALALSLEIYLDGLVIDLQAVKVAEEIAAEKDGKVSTSSSTDPDKVQQCFRPALIAPLLIAAHSALSSLPHHQHPDGHLSLPALSTQWCHLLASQHHSISQLATDCRQCLCWRPR